MKIFVSSTILLASSSESDFELSKRIKLREVKK